MVDIGRGEYGEVDGGSIWGRAYILDGLFSDTDHLGIMIDL